MSRAGWSADQLLAEVRAAVPDMEDLAFTHGDFCLPNVLVQGGEVTGMVDWGRAGVADRYQDIALLLRSFDANAGGELDAVLCREYGLARLDWRGIEFYRLLDEFF